MTTHSHSTMRALRPHTQHDPISLERKRREFHGNFSHPVINLDHVTSWIPLFSDFAARRWKGCNAEKEMHGDEVGQYGYSLEIDRLHQFESTAFLQDFNYFDFRVEQGTSKTIFASNGV